MLTIWLERVAKTASLSRAVRRIDARPGGQHLELEPINGFRSPGEFARFKTFLAEGVASGELREVSPDPTYHAGEIYGGRWFEHATKGHIWRLVPPDPPFRGVFERVIRESQ